MEALSKASGTHKVTDMRGRESSGPAPGTQGSVTYAC
jgi:hypothetical protein